MEKKNDRTIRSLEGLLHDIKSIKTDLKEIKIGFQETNARLDKIELKIKR